MKEPGFDGGERQSDDFGGGGCKVMMGGSHQRKPWKR